METDSIPLLITIFVCLMLSALFSATETAFSSLNQVKLKSMAAAGNKKAAKTLATAEKYDKLLTTILIGNNIVNISMSSIATVLFIALLGNSGATVSTVVITIVVLIFGEITPKSLAKEAPESFAMTVTPVIKALIFVFTPVNFIFTSWKKLLVKVFRVKNEKVVTDEDILTIVEEAESTGELNADESEIIRSAIEFRDLEARDVLTPRVHLTAVEVSQSPEEIYQVFKTSEYSRLPVYEESPDRIIGILHQKNFYEKVMMNGGSVKDTVSPTKFVSEGAKLGDLLQVLRNAHVHMAVVVDEYGGTAGILTMEDILEELVGDIYDEHDEEEILIRRVGDGYRVMCSASVNDFFETVGYEEETDATTVGGWVMEKLEKIPVKGDSFGSGSLALTVTRARNNRPIEVFVKVEAQSETEENEAEKKKTLNG